MYFLGLIVFVIAKLLSYIISAYLIIIIASVILSWIQPDPYNPIVRFLYAATQPVYSRLRKILPQAIYSSGIDFTPMIVAFILMLAQEVLLRELFKLARYLGYY